MPRALRGFRTGLAYRLKQRFPAFAAAWDDALARAQQGLVAEARKTMLGHSGALRVALEDIEIEDFTMLIPPRDDEYDQS